MEWEIRSVEPSVLNSFLEEAGGASLRTGRRPVLLKFALDGLQWTGILRLAPKDHMLCAVSSPYRSIASALTRWIRPFVDDGTFLGRFAKEMRRHGVAQASVPPALLFPFSGWGVYGGKKVKAIGRNAPDIGEFRVGGMLVPTSMANDVIAYHIEQMRQFGQHSVIPAIEGIEYSMSEGGPMRREFWPFHGRISPVADQCDSVGPNLENILELLDAEIEWMRQGNPSKLQLDFRSIVRPSLDFAVNNVDGNTPGGILRRKMLRRRAILLGLLQWPQTYDLLQLQLQELRRQTPKEELREFLMTLIGDVSDVVSQLEKSFPVLLENPLLRIGQ